MILIIVVDDFRIFLPGVFTDFRIFKKYISMTFKRKISCEKNLESIVIIIIIVFLIFATLFNLFF